MNATLTLILAICYVSMGCSEGQPIALLVAPDSHQTVSSDRRGGLERIVYHLTNPNSEGVSIEVVGKSCDCINAQVVPSVVSPQSTSQLSLQARVPLAGSSHGTVTLLSTILGSGQHEPRKLMVSYRLDAIRGIGLALAPSELSLVDSREAEVTATVSLSSYGSGEPQDALFVALPAVEQLDHQWIVPWTDDGAGGYSAVVSIIAKKSIGDSLVTDIKCYVPTDVGTTLEQIIRYKQ